MAKSLAQKIFPKEFYFDSAGTDAGANIGANKRAISVMNDYGIDLTSHLSKDLTDVNVVEYDYIVALDSYVFEYITQEYPNIRNQMIKWQIEDPYYGTIDTYKRCAEEILENLRVLSNKLGLSQLGSIDIKHDCSSDT